MPSFKTLISNVLGYYLTGSIPIFLLSFIYFVVFLRVLAGHQQFSGFEIRLASWFFYETLALWAMTLGLAFNEFVYKRNKYAIWVIIFIVITIYGQFKHDSILLCFFLFFLKFLICVVDYKYLKLGKAIFAQLLLHSFAGAAALFCFGATMMGLIVARVPQETFINVTPFLGGFWYFGWLAVVEFFRKLVMKTQRRIIDHNRRKHGDQHIPSFMHDYYYDENEN